MKAREMEAITVVNMEDMRNFAVGMRLADTNGQRLVVRRIDLDVGVLYANQETLREKLSRWLLTAWRGAW